MKKFLFVLSALSLAATASFAVEKATTKTETYKEEKTHTKHVPTPDHDKNHKSHSVDKTSSMKGATTTAED